MYVCVYVFLPLFRVLVVTVFGCLREDLSMRVRVCSCFHLANECFIYTKTQGCMCGFAQLNGDI